MLLEHPDSRGIFHEVWVPIRTLHQGWAADEAVPFRSAAAGILTALGSFLLESDKGWLEGNSRGTSSVLVPP